MGLFARPSRIARTTQNLPGDIRQATNPRAGLLALDGGGKAFRYGINFRVTGIAFPAS
jgi:hypothetical protein